MLLSFRGVGLFWSLLDFGLGFGFEFELFGGVGVGGFVAVL